MNRLLMAGKTALVSGGSNGIARAQAELFASEGAKVVIGDIDDVAGEQVAADIRKAGGSALYVHLDVSSERSWVSAVATAMDAFGGLTTLLNTAGIYRMASIDDESPEGFLRMATVNQLGVLLGMKSALPALRASGNGAILNMASAAAVRVYPEQIAYSASKAAVKLMSQTAANENGRFGVRVNSIYPGPVKTGMLKDATREVLDAALSTMPLGRMATPEDIAYGSLYLCSDLAINVTGAELAIDGGLLTR
ncbi:SDR family NAD(P)-dependent oxidoreductase [Novosphingobium colocasiae]|uniref:Short-chain dehydrogenase/reductase n=1 Tax=Novosphingobium colocasiae TaxID=1256513 RepID=A0A918PMU9_9SPHN|nr:SDR family oxidoreductase [Novosphingobium colocasiae]GGZ15162.1 putative short-chain dehydrogenase/reductase [Novosphingobium colocasiae]